MNEVLKDLETKPKRKVSYNQEAVLCPSCTKRIRLNNDGRMRIHLVGKIGSPRCKGDNDFPRKATMTVPPAVATLFSDKS